MAVQTSYPGVYVQEVPSGVRTIAGVSTSIALFIGRTRTGPLNEPVLCSSYSDFTRNFTDGHTDNELGQSVKLFFLNGGSTCYVIRVADGAVASSVLLMNQANEDVLRFTSKSPGIIGNDIRINISYNGLNPEATFNVELFRWEVNSAGLATKVGQENWQGLSMDPQHSKYASMYLTQNSRLVEVTDEYAPQVTAGTIVLPDAYSQSGHPLQDDSDANFVAALDLVLARGTSFRISVAGRSPANVDLSSLDTSVVTTKADILDAIEGLINDVLPATTPVTVSDLPGPLISGTSSCYIRIESESTPGNPGGDVYIEPAASNDLARPLMLGTAQGGLEVPRYSAARPVPNGIVFDISNLVSFGGRSITDFNRITVGTTDVELIDAFSINIGGPSIFQDANTPVPSLNDNFDGIREKLAIISNAINHQRSLNTAFRWSSQVWGQRLAILPGEGSDNSSGTVETSDAGGGGVDIGGDFLSNVRYYSLGTTGTGLYQTSGVAGNDGNPPTLSNYTDIFPIIERDVDLFNLMLLPSDSGHSAGIRASLWGPVSVFCQEQRAFLLMDAPGDWTTVQRAIDSSTGVNSLRIGLVKDHSAIFYPRLTINENGLNRQVGPSGAIAGLMARIDGSRGVWKAPAGTEADIRGISGLEYRLSDSDNGHLNPNAINTIRIFPNGIVNWGARTMDGDDDFASEWKYIPVRRTALFIEESLFRGLKWVVFEPNDEPLWSQIRLNVGAFMHNLFRQGAFQGTKKQDAYFVKCDSETTTQNDINLGIVNIWVGFAPLKPAEFVILYLQQMTGQIQV